MSRTVVNSVGAKIAPFWADKSKMWFAQAEAKFN